jgi:soluble lytic murein transglycosylase-like protein
MAISDMVYAAAESAGINPPTLAVQVANVESSLNPNVPDGLYGEVGVMQLKPESFPGVNVRDLQTNITTGVNYLAEQISRFGDLLAGVAAYNCGPSCVASAISHYGSANYAWLAGVPASTLDYLTKVFGSLPQIGAAGGDSSPIVSNTSPDSSNLLLYSGLAVGAVLLLWLLF